MEREKEGKKAQDQRASEEQKCANRGKMNKNEVMLHARCAVMMMRGYKKTARARAL